MARSSRNYPEGCYDFFITARCGNKEWFRIPLPVVWDLLSGYLNFFPRGYNFKIRAFILMANHFHMIVTADTIDLPIVMNRIMGESAKEINRRCGSINQVWGRPYHASLVRGYFHYQNVYKYLYRNPIEAGVCERVEDYPYSSIRGLLGFEHLMIPVEDGILTEDPEYQLRWLNTKPSNAGYRGEIRKALRRRIFSFGQNKDRAKHPMDDDQI